MEEQPDTEDVKPEKADLGKFLFPIMAGVLILVGIYYIFGKYDVPTQSVPTIAPQVTSTANSNQKDSGEEVTVLEDIKIEDIVVGTGTEAKNGNRVTVNYLGTFTNGEKFDSSYDRNQPFAFNLGAGEVIKGWDEGVAGMKVGGKRKLTIPYTKAYGEAGIPGAIPPKSTLIFEVELLKVE